MYIPRNMFFSHSVYRIMSEQSSQEGDQCTILFLVNHM